MLPYASYLRVYEPFASLRGTSDAGQLGDQEAVERAPVTWQDEQRTVLARALVGRAPMGGHDAALSGAYVLRRSGRAFFCPVDMPLRSWLSMTELVDSVGNSAAPFVVSAEAMELADEQFLRWRRDHPTAVPHIRQATWEVPRAWFVLVHQNEKSTYEASGRPSVRFTATIEAARERVRSSLRILRRVMDDREVTGALDGVNAWLSAFDDESWVELDYAGVGQLLGDRLPTDTSADEIHRAIAALARGDMAAAGGAYRSFQERWRQVNAFERAN